MVYHQKQWRMEHFDEECKKWLLLFLEFVSYDHNPETSLREFISSRDYAITKSHHRFIVDQVCYVHLYICAYQQGKVWFALAQMHHI